MGSAGILSDRRGVTTPSSKSSAKTSAARCKRVYKLHDERYLQPGRACWILAVVPARGCNTPVRRCLPKERWWNRPPAACCHHQNSRIVVGDVFAITGASAETIWLRCSAVRHGTRYTGPSRRSSAQRRSVRACRRAGRAACSRRSLSGQTVPGPDFQQLRAVCKLGFQKFAWSSPIALAKVDRAVSARAPSQSLARLSHFHPSVGSCVPCSWARPSLTVPCLAVTTAKSSRWSVSSKPAGRGQSRLRPR